MNGDARRVAENAARSSYGRLLSVLASGSRDIAAAEDALSEAFVSALLHWPDRGIPDNPDAWLLTAARNGQRNLFRHANVREAASLDLKQRYDELAELQSNFPDERLKMLFVCAHPAIDAGVRTPLMLQVVLGLDAARIAKAFCVAPATIGQRLVRAKSKIRDSGLAFELPEPEHLPQRLSEVLDAIYAAFGTGWDAVAAPGERGYGLSDEAIYLCRLVIELLPDEPEPRGLLALMLYCDARKHARRDAQGGFVPLHDQDSAKWSRDMIIEAEQWLTLASRAAMFGRYQCEAAIQSVHVQRGVTGVANHAALRALYDLLIARCPTVGNQVARAAMLLDAGDPHSAADALDAVPLEQTRTYQPYWVTRASVASALGDTSMSKANLQTAIELSEDSATRAFLEAKLA